MQNNHDHTIFQEIEEDLQRQRIEALWKKYGSTLLSCALIIIVVTALVMGWKSYRHNHSQQDTSGLAQIVIDQEAQKPQDMIEALMAYDKAHQGTAQSAIARLYAAQEAATQSQTAKALELYDSVASDQKIPAVYAQLANLLYVLTDMDEGEPAKLEARLQPLMQKDVIWRFMAYELAGHLAYHAGDLAKAKALFVELINMDGVPPGIMKRASDMLILVVDGSPQ